MILLLVAHPAMQGNLLIRGYHDAAWAVCFLSLALWAYERTRFVVYVIAVVLAAMWKEDIPFIILGFSALAFLQRRPWCWRLFPVCFACLYIAVAFTALHFIGGVAATHNKVYFQHLGETPWDIVRTLFFHPETWIAHAFSPDKLAEMKLLFLPFGFLSFLAPEYLFVPLSQFAEVCLAGPHYIVDVGYWYVLPVLPFVFYSAVIGVERLLRFAYWLVGLARHLGKKELSSKKLSPGVESLARKCAGGGGRFAFIT